MRKSALLLVTGAVSWIALMTAVAQMPANAPMVRGAVKKPGELWREKMSMSMAGMSMPARSQDVCRPKDNPEAGGGSLPDKNCTIYDSKFAPNASTLKFRCTGQMAGEGVVEARRRGDTMITDMAITTKDGTMNMHGESTRLGTACEYVDYSNAKFEAPQVKTVTVDPCAEPTKKLRENSGNVRNLVQMFLGPNALCKSNNALKDYCAAVNSPGGFISLRNVERQNANLPPADFSDLSRYSAKERKVVEASYRESDRLQRTPLQASIDACGLGKGEPGVEALRTKLLPVAEANNAWLFLVAEGDDAILSRLGTVAKANCTGRRFTTPKAPLYRSLCDPFAPDLIAGRLAQARSAARGTEFSDNGSGSGSAGGGGAGAASTTAAGAPGQPGAIANCPEGSDPASCQDPNAAKSNKAQEAIDKTKKALRGIFGR